MPALKVGSAEALEAHARQAGIGAVVDPLAFERLQRFLGLRGRWDKTHNLVGPESRRDPWRRDVLDALALQQVLDSTLPLVDIGSGGGAPGLLLALLEDRPVHLVEPAAKRAAFLRQAVRDLGLEQVRVHRARWPADLGLEAIQVVSRAVVAPEAWPALAQQGVGVCAVIRMLAHERPSCGLTLLAELDYDLGPAGKRRVERRGVSRETSVPSAT